MVLQLLFFKSLYIALLIYWVHEQSMTKYIKIHAGSCHSRGNSAVSSHWEQGMPHLLSQKLVDTNAQRK